MAELDIILGEMREGFRRIEAHIGKLHDDYSAHLLVCNGKFSELRTTQTAKDAASAERENHNYLPFIIKAAITFLTGTGLIFLYRVVIHVA